MKVLDSQFPPRPTTLAQALLRSLISPGDLVIDATAGNGYDTVFLAECVGETGRVLAFDIQEAALISARERIDRMNLERRVELIQASHVQMSMYAEPESVQAIMFNLGYLPGENHQVTTLVQETLSALEIATCLLVTGGALSVICYPGHLEGAGEAEAVEAWITSLSAKGYRVAKYGAMGTRKPAPFLLLAKK